MLTGDRQDALDKVLEVPGLTNFERETIKAWKYQEQMGKGEEWMAVNNTRSVVVSAVTRALKKASRFHATKSEV